MTRRALSRSQTIALCLRQEGKCGCGCGKKLDPFGEGVIDEHVTPRALADQAHVAERDALDNRALFRKPCATGKTKGDVKQIAKARRQGGGKGSQRAKRERERAEGRHKEIQGRGFQTNKDGPFRAKIGGGWERRE